MTKNELENAKESLRTTLESQKEMFSVSKEELAMFVNYQSLFWKNYELTESDKAELVTYLENYIFVKHDHSGYAVLSNEPFDNTWYDKNKPTDEYFWNLYCMHHAQKGDLDRASLDLLGKTTLPNLMNCLGNPKEKLNAQRKRYGLVLGDVQSGKTSTYAGLICKAADAGMKVVILLAGTTENLRQQTQERMEEDVVGLTIRNDYFKNTQRLQVGVGNLNGWENKVSAYTLYDEDFTIRNANNMTSIASQKSLVLFVVKKNVPVLTHLHEWLTGPNQNFNEQGYLPYSLLLIDDEADNASINTRDSTLDPTATNKKIREICEAFMDTNYVGFTATPYANIFINPESDNDMITADLFPKDFIYVLPTPEPYIGAQRIFGEPTLEHPNYGNCSYMLRYITDIREPSRTELRGMTENQRNESLIYYNHKKTWKGILPDSLISAIRCFYLANAIRDLDDKQFDDPRTMLINISRFTNVHSYIKKNIKKIVEDDYCEMRINFSNDSSKNTQNELYNELHRLFDQNYADCGLTWEQVGDKNVLLKGEPPKVIVVNGSKESKEDTPNYKKYPSLRIIAIGGLALSRGLTLKGLMTSYFYRNTCTYDVLMQMGRWFGYRPNYDKICRIWITNTSANWYKEIADATEELKTELARMNRLDLTPADFGLRIRRDNTALEITARNKMRKAGQCKVYITYWGDVFETPYFNKSAADNTYNFDVTTKWLQYLLNNGYVREKLQNRSTYLIRDVDRNNIVTILKDIRTSKQNWKFNVATLLQFIDSNSKELEKWDVAVVGGSGEDVEGMFCDDIKLKAVTRRISIRGEAFAFSHQGVVSGNNDGSIGLDDPNAVREEYEKLEAAENPMSALKINRCTWFKYAKRKPIIFIYPVRPSSKTNPEAVLKDYFDEIGNMPILGYAVGIPGFGHKLDSRDYYTNVVYQNNDGTFDMEDNTDEDE